MPRDEETTARIYGLPSAAERAAARAQFEATLKEIFTASLPSTAGAELLRSVVESDLWFVPVRDDGSFDTLEVKAGRYRPAIEPEPDPSIKKRRKKEGKGGLLLPVYAQEPDRPSTRLDGRSLARTLPEEAAGLLLHLPDSSPRELGREFFAELQRLADACDLEDLLVSPGPEQVEKLKQATWWVAMEGGVPVLDDTADDARVANAFTHPDRVGYSPHEIVPMKGEELFRRVVENDDVDGIVVNRGSRIGRGEDALSGLLLSPGFAHRLLAGEDIRPGAQPLPARSRQEVELWLDLRCFPWEGRELLEAPYPEESLIRATTTDPRASQWRMQETLGEPEPSAGRVWSPVFVVPAAGLAEPGFGPGATSILCAGLLAKELNAGALYGKDAERFWRPGRWLLFGRFLDAWNRERSRRRLALAAELAKLLPPGADQIPRSAILTVEGAALLREHPHGGSRAWIEATLRQAERYTKPWVWWG
jgi:hypothetical protein